MDFSNFKLNNNGKNEQLQNAKNGVRKEQVDKKFHNLFDAYDTNADGTLETSELISVFKHLKNVAGEDKILDSEENKNFNLELQKQANIQNADFMGFVKSVSEASVDIIETNEKQTSDGGKEVTTTYKDGTTETIAFYSNGDYKWKKTEKKFTETTYEMVYNGQKRQLNESEFKKVLAKIEEKKNAKTQQAGLEGKSFKMPASESVDAFANSIVKVEKKEVYSPRFIAETLGVNTETEDGKKVTERLSQLPQETLEKLKDGKELKELISSQELEPTFDNISNILEITEGVTLRNEEEFKASEAQRQEILTQIKAANFMANLYETLAEYNDQYTDSVGLFGLGSEGFGYVLNKLGLDGENHYQFADSCKEWAKNTSELKVLNPQKFKEGFKKIYGKNADKWGIDYNSDAFKKCFALAESGKAYDKDNKMTDEYKEAIVKAMNIVPDDPNDSTFNQVMNGFGEALIMYMSLGLASGTEAGITLAKSTMGAFSKLGVQIASKQAKNKLLQGALRFTGQAVKLVGPALNEGTKMYLYTTAEGTAMNVSNRAIKQDGFDKLLDTQAQVMTNADGSFTFGAFAGVFGTTVTQKVMQRASGVATKVTTALSEKFSQGVVNANEVFATIMEKSAPTKIAEAAAFAVDVVGFTAFESALTIANTLQREGTLTPEKLADTLMEEFGHQGYSLGQIKVISHLIMMLSGSRSARMQSQKYLQENLPQLKGVTVEGANGGKEGFKINLPDGRRIECKNTSEMISSLQLMVRGETALSSKFDKMKEVKATTENVTTMNFEQMSNRLKNGHVNYTLSTTEDGRNLVKIENSTKLFTANRFDYYEFDKNGNLVKSQTQISEASAKEMFTNFKNAQTRNIRNRGGRLNAGVPIMDMAEGIEANATAKDIRNNAKVETQEKTIEINTQNTLAEFQTYDDLLLNAPKADIKVEEMDEYLRMNRYSEEDIARLKEALGDDYAKCINIRKFAEEIFGNSMGSSGVDDLIEDYNQIPAEQKPLMDLLNRTSIDFLCNKLCIGMEEVLDIVFGGNGDSAEVVRKCYDLSRKTGVSIRDLTNSIGNNQEELLDNVTPEKVLAYKQMSEVLSLGGFSYGILNDIAAIKNPEKITKEFLEDYKDTINRFAELGIYGYETGIDPVEQLTKLKAVEKQLKENNIDLSWYSDSNQGLKIYLKQLENIMQSKDISKISEFLSSCSDECKYNHANDILQFAQDCYMSNPKEFAEMLNIIDKVPNGKDAFWGLREMIDKQIKKGTFDINGVKEVAQAFIDTGLWLKDGSNAYAFFASDYSTQKPNYKGIAKFIRELKEFYNENSKYSIDAYMHELWRGGHFDSMEQKFKQLKELGLYGKVAPCDLRCLLENANNENTFNLIVAFHNEPLVKNEIFYYKESSVEVLTKRIDNLKKIIEENNTEYNNISLNEKIELIRALNERNEFYGFLRPHFSNIDKMSIKNLVEGKEDFALQIFNNPEYKASNLNMADKVAIFRESNENNESNILNLITRFKDTKRSNDVFSTRGLILDILRSEKLNWFMSQDLNALDNFVSELYDKSMKNREEFVNNPKDNSDTVEFFRRSYKQLIFLAANNSKEGVEALLKTKQIPDVNRSLNTFYSFDKSELDLFKKMYNSNKPEQIAEIIDIISFLQTDIKEMYLGGKIELLEKISHVSDEVLNSCRKYSDVNVDAKIEELTTSLGKKRDIVIIPFKQQQLFVKNILANNNPNVENVLKTFDFEQYDKKGLPLKYPREEFTANVEKIIKDLSIEEQVLVLSHFGLERGEAGFDGLPNNKTFANSKASPKANEVAKLVKAEIEKFTTNNTIKTGDKTVDEVLNGLIQGLPEFTSIVGKKQHGTHAYSVDIHTLKVLQSAMNNPLYEKLSDRDKTILKISALCHDFGKRGGVVDEGHANLSAEYVASILDKFSFPQGMKDRIIDIVENHHWFEKYNTGRATAEDVAVRCRRPEDFIIYEILAKSDFENVNKTFHIEKSGGVNNQVEFNRYMQEKMVAIDKALALMYSKSNLIFDTQFMQNGERFPRENAIIDGEQMELKVLDLNKLEDNTDLQQFGFSKGVTKDNARFTIHMTSPTKSSMESVTILTKNSMNNSAWSTSLIKASNNRTYGNRRFGFIFDVDQANISEAYYDNTGSGCGKNINVFKTILFEQNDAARTYVKSYLMQELYKKGVSLTNEEYSQLSKVLMSKKYTTQITKDIKIGDKVIKASDLRECLETSRDALFFGGDTHSEIVSINPRVKGLIAKVEKLEDCPEEFLKFAKENNLPIILMKPTKEM